MTNEIYNEAMEPIENPDLTLGRLTPGTRTVHHDAVLEQLGAVAENENKEGNRK